MDNSGTFARRINRRAANLGKNIPKLRRDVVIEMFSEVVFSTPADTGQARSNWQIGVNGIPSGIRPAYAPGRHLGTGEGANASGALSAGLPKIDAAGGDDTLYIVNNVPYIMKLNDGWSEQAPANFIEKAMDRARKRVQRGRLLE